MTFEGKKIVCGARSAIKALRAGRAEKIFLARDASESVTGPVRESAEEKSVPVDGTHSMRELGKAASIEIGAAAVTVLK
ncbi:MAG: ribosomal L7Ae/L30e/S12e/Gadd45 family protein [Clostridia bacterium]|nr:ribosomal L7Ae/L30e/S12e/Gadd45 family protein [Clostridia bacterium]